MRSEPLTVPTPGRVASRLRPEELAAFAAGTETRLGDLLGARPASDGETEGTRFAVWAPRATKVGVMGSFNGWRAERHPMRPVADTGVWELFVAEVGPGVMYKYEVRCDPRGPDDDDPVDHGEGERVVEKADPFARVAEVRPRSASIIAPPRRHPWEDEAWMAARGDHVRPGRPISIYEVHLGSWRRHADGSWLGYRALADELLPYVAELGFTHVELLPVTEHPFDASWGYQTLGYFALTSRYGEPDDFRAFVEAAHRLGLGVLLDWVPAHFPLDQHGLARFDGGPLYEHPDPRRGEHPDWGTAIFDFGRPEVVSFLTSSARFWLDEYHLDGLRVDAVASMLYLDYSRAPGDWEPNEEGGNQNLEAVSFLRHLTRSLHETCPGVLLCAEESTAWPGVTAPVETGGLGFDMKWNMGWMNDTLAYVRLEPSARPGDHQRITFSIHYAHSERHVLPLSHDEVVHLKGALVSKLPGSPAERLAGLRLLLGYMWTHPGAKLLFMGGELAQPSEWNEEVQLAWGLLEEPGHRGVQAWVRRLNELYRSEPALHARDEDPAGFDWIEVEEAARGILLYVRNGQAGEAVAVSANFTNQPKAGYRIELPWASGAEIVVASDAPEFGGKGRARIVYGSGAVGEAAAGDRRTVELFLPPLTCVLLRPPAPARSNEKSRTSTVTP